MVCGSVHHNPVRTTRRHPDPMPASLSVVLFPKAVLNRGRAGEEGSSTRVDGVVAQGGDAGPEPAAGREREWEAAMTAAPTSRTMLPEQAVSAVTLGPPKSKKELMQSARMARLAPAGVRHLFRRPGAGTSDRDDSPGSPGGSPRLTMKDLAQNTFGSDIDFNQHVAAAALFLALMRCPMTRASRRRVLKMADPLLIYIIKYKLSCFGKIWTFVLCCLFHGDDLRRYSQADPLHQFPRPKHLGPGDSERNTKNSLQPST